MEAVNGNTPPAYGTLSGGKPVNNVSSYLTCQYEWDEEAPTTNGNGATVGTTTNHHTCTLPAMIAPGYKRACHLHVLHVLRDSLHHFLTREQLPDNKLPEHLVKLRAEQTYALMATYDQLQSAINPTAKTKAAPRKSTAKKLADTLNKQSIN